MKSIDSVVLSNTLSPSEKQQFSLTDSTELLGGDSSSTAQQNSDAVVIATSLKSVNTAGSTDSPSFQQLYEALSLTAKEIVDKINEQLKASLPDGVQSLTPEQVTPDATAERIVNGSVAFFDIYAKQNKNLEGEELLNSFLGQVRKGIDQGYGEAFDILKGLGAFDIEGVQKGVETTRSLIDEKLAAFEAAKRKELGLEPKESAASVAANKAKSDVLAQAGSAINTVA